MTRKNICGCLLVCYLLFVQVGTCAAAYQVTEQELTKLETIFNQLENTNQKQEKILSEQEKTLTESKMELSKAKQSLQTSEDLLRRANKSLEQSAREVRKIKAQRTVAYCTAIAALIYAICRK